MIDAFVAAGEFQARIKISGKYNILCGMSGTGKTLLRERLDGITLAPTGTYRYDGPGRIISLSAIQEATGVNWIRNTSGNLIVIEEGSVFLSANDYLRDIQASTNYFLIIAREQFNRLPYGVKNIFGVEQHGEHFNTVPLFDASSDSIKINPGDTAVCEGSGLDCRAIQKKLPCCVRPAYGKDKVVAVLRSLKNVRVVIVDWCGTAGATLEIMRLCDEKGIKYFWSPSFEYELLANRWLCGDQGKQLRQLYLERVLDFNSEESFYTECVDYCLKHQLGVGYSKSSDGPLADLVCNGKALFGTTLKEGEPRPVKLDWLYPELTVAGGSGFKGGVNKLKLE